MEIFGDEWCNRYFWVALISAGILILATPMVMVVLNMMPINLFDWVKSSAMFVGGVLFIMYSVSGTLLYFRY